MDFTMNLTHVKLETGRLILRPWQENDLTDFYEYASVPGVGEMAGWKHHESMEESQRILKGFIENKNVFAIIYRENQKAIGSLGLHYSWANDESVFKDLKLKEIGYVLSREYWGKGLMPEAVKAVIDFCFYKCRMEALTIGHFSCNSQSRRVIEKCGFQFVKESQYYAKQLQKSFDDVKYILYR